MKILCKSRLLPAVRETRLRVALGEAQASAWRMGAVTLAAGRERAVVDWGDGSQEEVGGGVTLSHAYARGGEYEIVLSDDISTLSPIGTAEEMLAFAPCYRSFRSNATLLRGLAARAFQGCVNLATVDCNASALDTLNPGAFSGCTALPRVLRLPKLRSLPGPGVLPPFLGCSQIEEIHLSAAHEAEIKSSGAWSRDQTLGTGRAVVTFDP